MLKYTSFKFSWQLWVICIWIGSYEGGLQIKVIRNNIVLFYCQQGVNSVKECQNHVLTVSVRQILIQNIKTRRLLIITCEETIKWKLILNADTADLLPLTMTTWRNTYQWCIEKKSNSNAMIVTYKSYKPIHKRI